jgi:hypothetical protein
MAHAAVAPTQPVALAQPVVVAVPTAPPTELPSAAVATVVPAATEGPGPPVAATASVIARAPSVPSTVPALSAPAPVTVTASPSPPATQVTSGPASRIVLDERFADNARGWPNDPQSTAWLGDDGYRLFARRPGQFVAIGIPAVPRLRTVTTTATFRKVGGPPGGGYGLIVRDQMDEPRDGVNQRGRYYVLEAGDRGELGVWRRDGDRWIDLVPWTPSQVVRPGDQPNELSVRADGDRLVFIVNGTEVANQVDASLAAGAVGVFAGGDGNQVVLQHVAVESPE